MIEDSLRTPEDRLPESFIRVCRAVKNGRPRRVIEHILRHGYITTAELSTSYNYSHAPRAAQDVKDCGIPLLSHNVKNPSTGRRMAVYTFDLGGSVAEGRTEGRLPFSRAFKETLVARDGSRDALTGQPLPTRHLQIDHRVPYQVGGDTTERRAEDFMLLSRPSQRSKSWDCEACVNFREYRNPVTCETCYWAFPENYQHVATRTERRLDIIWNEDEVRDYDSAQAESRTANETLSYRIKRLLRKQS